MKQTIIVAVICLIVAGAAGFFAGMHFRPNRGFVMQQGGGRFGGGYAMFGNGNGNGQMIRPVRGQVISTDNNSMTIKLQDGSSKLVVVSGSTMFVKSDTAAQSDIKAGDTVMVFGPQNSDGSVTAQNVQINPPDRQMMMTGTPSAAPTQSTGY